MSVYCCEICNGIFDEPYHGTERIDCGSGIYKKEAFDCCPICGEEGHFYAADRCPVCAGLKREDTPLCPACREALKERFGQLVEDLTAAEREVLDDWLDGMSIESWRQFE